MKELLADYLHIPVGDIENYEYQSKSYDLEIGKENDFGKSYPTVIGDIYEPQYKVYTKDSYTLVNLEELLMFLYNRIKK